MNNKAFLKNGELTAGYINETEINTQIVAVYEVVRLISGKALFFEDHFIRLQRSANLLGFELKCSALTIKLHIEKLCKISDIHTMNVKLIIQLAQEQIIYVYFIATAYPPDYAYKSGVKCNFLSIERPNPNAKSVGVNFDIRQKIEDRLESNQVFETILVNNTGIITEGSKSNIFFINENKLYTAPNALVLQGITRAKVIELAASLKIEVEFAEITATEIAKFDAAFITGTSPKILPIAQIDSIKFNTENNTLQQLMDAYNQLINSYLTNA